MQQPPSEGRPLAGACVMIARAENRADSLAAGLRDLGAEVILQPAIRILPPDDWRPADAALARLGEFDWVVFSSANGVRYLLDRCAEIGKRLSGKEIIDRAIPIRFNRVAAIGPGTAGELARHGFRADLIPEVFRAEALADALAKYGAAGRRFLLVRASRGREVLAERLVAAGAEVEQIVVYRSVDVDRPEPENARRLAAGEIDWITVTSSAIARSLVGLFGGDLRRAKLASISPITSGVLRELGFNPSVEALDYTLPGLTAAILTHR